MGDKKGKGITVKLAGVQSQGKVGRLAAKGAVRKKSRKGRRKYGFESLKGNEFSVDGQFIYKEQIIDREKYLYKKLVINEDTGEVLRHVEHKLSEHKNRGSEKTKKNKI